MRRGTAGYWYVKVGWQGAPFGMGRTYLSIDFGDYDHVTPDVHAWALGFAVVQAVDVAATDLYAGVRFQDARAAGMAQQAVVSLILGARIRF